MSRPPPLCTYFVRGHCRHGTACRFTHAAATQSEGSPLPVHHRLFVEAPAAGSVTGLADYGGKLSLRLMSYNILADQYARQHAAELYSTVHRDLLDWPRRAALLAAEVAHWRPDVVCMQVGHKATRWAVYFALLITSRRSVTVPNP